MASERTLARLDFWIWVLIFGGLLVLTLGIASLDAAAVAGWAMVVTGSLLALAGAVLLVVRSRLNSDTEGP